MNTKEFWQAYAGGMTPAEFIVQFQSRNPRRCAEHYASRMPGMYGIVRRNTWKDTFRAPEQHVRDEVVHMLTAYLDETRSEWESAVEEYDRLAAEARRNAPEPSCEQLSEPANDESRLEAAEVPVPDEEPAEAAPAQNETPAEEVPMPDEESAQIAPDNVQEAEKPEANETQEEQQER